MRNLTALLLVAAACGGSSPSSSLGNRGGGGGPAGPVPTIGWSVAESDFGGDFTTTGTPALAADAQAVLIAQRGEDGARGAPNLALEIRGRDDRAIASHVVVTADDGEMSEAPADPYAAQIASGNAWLADSHARYGWTPLAVAEVKADSDSFLDAERWTATVGDVSVAFDVSGKLEIVAGGAAVVGRTMDGWLAKDSPMYPGAGPDETCTNPIALSGAYLDAARKVAVLRVSYRGTDTCWEPDSQYHVVAW